VPAPGTCIVDHRCFSGAGGDLAFCQRRSAPWMPPSEAGRRTVFVSSLLVRVSQCRRASPRVVLDPVAMPRSRSPHATMRDLGYPYATWKAEATQELDQRHGLSAIVIAERIWRQFYAQKLTPREAADRAQLVYSRTPKR
jgi:hypothetical protein